MGGGPSSSGSTAATIPKELKPLYTQTGQNVQELQDANPVTNYIGSNPTQIAPLSGTTNKSLGLLNTNLDNASQPLENSEIVQAGKRYFDYSIAPGITNEATLSGLGRSTANTNALAAAEAQTALPLLQQEQARRDAMIAGGLQAGDIERSVVQQGYNAAKEDSLRQQALAENALFSPLSQLPSTFGSKSSTSGSSGGLSVVCTELNRQGLMDDATLEADTLFGQALPDNVIRGYHLWAVPLARLMKKSKLVTRLVAPMGLAWANEMYRRVTGKGQGSKFGAALLKYGVPVCGWMGRQRVQREILCS